MTTSSTSKEGAKESDESGFGCLLVVLVLGFIAIAVCVLLEVVSWILPWEFSLFATIGGILGLVVIGLIAAGVIATTDTGTDSSDDDSGSWKSSEYYESMGNQSIRVTSWQDAERSARDFMRANGYPGATLTGPGADGGVDVVAAGAIAQVKHYNVPIGEPAIVQLAGTTMRQQYQGRKALFFSSSGYTAKAMKTGHELGVTLYKLNHSLHWVRVY